jgi:hypothetical protein
VCGESVNPTLPHIFNSIFRNDTSPVPIRYCNLHRVLHFEEEKQMEKKSNAFLEQERIPVLMRKGKASSLESYPLSSAFRSQKFRII